MSLNSNIVVGISGEFRGPAGVSQPVDDLNLRFLAELPNGTASGQANRRYVARRTIAAGGNENLDLAGALPDAFGATITMTAVKAILVLASAANTNEVIVGGATSNAFVGPFGASAHTAAVRPGGALLFVARNTGWTVTAGTGDLLRIANGGGGTSVTYDIVIIGVG
jgi:hypothetical protein